jgi:arabinogalactan oligomer/maltooligosaccharide transport system substrate-binding protein
VVLIFGNYQYIQNRLALRPTAPNTPIPAVAAPTDTSEPALQPAPSETPSEELTPSTSTPISPTSLPGPVKITVWITQKSDALNKQITLYQETNPSVTISVTVVTQDKINDQWTQGVANGTAPDLMLADNTNLWKLLKAKAVQPLDEATKGSLKGYTNTALSGMTIGGNLYGVPVRFELDGLLYNTSMVDNPPAKISDLSLLFRTGTKYGLVKSPTSLYGYMSAYGGTLADKNGRCIATPVGFEDALNDMRQVKKYGSFLVDDPAIIREKFKAEQIAMILDNSSQLADYVQALGDKVASAPMPGATNPASVIVKQTGFYINPASQNQKLAVDLALTLSNAQAQTAYMAEYWVPTRSDVQVKDPAIKGFVDGAQTGYPIPQAAWFSNWEGPFLDMINQVYNNQFDIPDAIRLACKNMDALNNK